MFFARRHVSSVVGRRTSRSEIHGEKGERAIWKFHLFPPANASPPVSEASNVRVSNVRSPVMRRDYLETKKEELEKKHRSFVSSGSFDLNPLEIRTVTNNVRTGHK